MPVQHADEQVGSFLQGGSRVVVGPFLNVVCHKQLRFSHSDCSRLGNFPSTQLSIAFSLLGTISFMPDQTEQANSLLNNLDKQTDLKGQHSLTYYLTLFICGGTCHSLLGISFSSENSLFIQLWGGGGLCIITSFIL